MDPVTPQAQAETLIERLREAATVLDEPFHHDAIAVMLMEVADFLAALTPPAGDLFASDAEADEFVADIYAERRAATPQAGAQGADEERLRNAAEAAGITYVGCDTPDALAEKVQELQARLKPADVAEALRVLLEATKEPQP